QAARCASAISSIGSPTAGSSRPRSAGSRTPMTHDRSAALALLREELKRPPFHEVLRPQALDADPSTGTVVIALDYRDEFAHAPNENSFCGGVIATLIDLAGHH